MSRQLSQVPSSDGLTLKIYVLFQKRFFKIIEKDSGSDSGNKSRSRSIGFSDFKSKFTEFEC